MIAFRCFQCQTTFKAPVEMVGSRTKCPRCGCPVQVPAPPTAVLAKTPSPSAPPPLAISLQRPGRPRSKAVLLLLCGLGLFAGAMLMGALVLFIGMSLGGWLKDRGAPDRAAAAGTGDAGKPPDGPASTQAGNPPDPAGSGADVPGEPLKGDTGMVDDLKVTTLKLPVQGLLPCMLWADAEGSAFLALEGDSGLLRRISFPECRVTKQKDLDRKFTWMSLSSEGLLLSDPDSEKIWVVDPATVEVKTKIAVPKLKRAASTPGLSLAVACDGGQFQSQKLYVVDLVKKTANLVAVPQGTSFDYGNNPFRGNVVGLNNPAVAPDGVYVFTQGDNRTVFPSGLPAALRGIPTMFRFSFKDGKLMYEESDAARDPQAGVTTASITFSLDSKWVCLPSPSGNIPDRPYTTAIYPVHTFSKHHCTLEQGPNPQTVGFDLNGGYIYTQNNEHELIVFTLTGVKKKEYSVKGGYLFDPKGGCIYTRDLRGGVQQYLVHPGGNQVVLLTAAAVYAVEVPKTP